MENPEGALALSSPMQRLTAFVESDRFNAFIIFVIILNAGLLGLETSPGVMNHLGRAVSLMSDICIWVFIVEAVLKLIAYRHRYFYSGWNVFDFLILAITLVPSGGAVSAFRGLRVLRVLRSLKLVSAIGHLRIIIKAILVSVPAVMWTGALLIIFFYIYGIVGQNMFGADFPDWFGTIGASIYTLFQVMTLESWSMGISRPVMAVHPWAWIYFVSFVLISSYTIINVIVGIVVNAVSEISAAEEVHKAEQEAKRQAKEPAGETSPDHNELADQLKALKSLVADLEKRLEK